MSEHSAHAPEPSVWPIATAASVLVTAFGILLQPFVAAAGAAGVALSVIGWSGRSVGKAAGAGEPAAPQGMLLFLGSESFFFGSLIAAYLYLRIRNGVWPPEGDSPLDASFAGLNTVVLLASGVTMHVAALAMRKNRFGAYRIGLVATIALGCAFLAGQAYEYMHVPFTIGSGLMGSTFFTLTGFHGAHVSAGIAVLLVLLARTLRDADAAPRRGFLDSATYYWHFVDAVWVVLYGVLYLL